MACLRTQISSNSVFNFMLVYVVTNKVNGKIYIGKTETTLKRRWDSHVVAAKRGSKSYFHAAIRKYGPAAFEATPLSSAVSRDNMEELEIFFIAKYHSTDCEIGYNLTNGGDGRGGFKHSEETKRKISRSERGKRLTPEQRVNVGRSHRGGRHSEKVRQGISLTLRRTWAKRDRNGPEELLRRKRISESWDVRRKASS